MDIGQLQLTRADYLTGTPCVAMAAVEDGAEPRIVIPTLPQALHLAAELERLASLPATSVPG